ncbi:Endoribonuclease XendoU [Trema orientale]|uniref:Endoribonuclease XendoU n=1 Tax=Trema orientale TaxID=63057 RepID=A0A2P5FZ98_TREOI|nr:Endoribonuclease XendoU [Trema orientale]
MDGLIKGILDVALGQDDDRRNESGPHQSRDERSRSSWAEVVSGEQDKGGEESHAHDHSHGRHGRNQWNAEVEQSDHRQEEWEKVDSRPPRRNQKITQGQYETGEDSYEQSRWSRKEDDESNNDGWETVGKKTPRRTHKVQKDNWQGYKRPPSEQEFSDEVEIGSTIEPTEEELSDLSQACNKLWELDANRLIPGKDYEIDCGEGKKVFQKEDMAGGSLFNWLNEDIFRRPTFSRFCSLLDNYNPNAGCKEVVTSEERQEQAAFIEEISRTAPIRYLHKYLSSKGIVSENYQDFKRTLTSLWFDLYGRGGTSGSSSAFEHVFVGEVKQRSEQEISGFHNWLQFYLEEAKGRVDYQGYIFPRRRGETPDSETQLLTIQFEWNGILKSVSSTLVGVSPEFEIALYTLCFFVGGEDNYVQLGPYSVNIKCYRFGDRIGSVFPVSEG